MQRIMITIGLIASLLTISFSQPSDKHKDFINSIYKETLTKKEAYQLLEKLCKKYPKRLSGSKGLEGAVQWSKLVMEGFNFDKVYLQDVMVPHWKRGETESASFINNKGKTESLNVLALGRSVATPKNGIIAEVIEVPSVEGIAELGKSKVEGKIVFINKPFEQQFVRTFDGYQATVGIRSNGPSEAARYGAVACIIRSVGTADDDFAHTGALKYADDVPRIPAAALGVKSAKKLSRSLNHNPNIKLSLKINSQTLPDILSHNVIGEITGKENPDKIIMIGGHLDAWDVGDGAHDDGAGLVQALYTFRTLQNLGYKPKNTLRVVLFTNEENGLRGGKEYAKIADAKHEDHIFALESDAGGFTPRGFSVKCSDSTLNKMNQWLHYFPKQTIEKIILGGGGADIGTLNELTETPVGILLPDSQRYFDFHHSPADVFDAVNARELELGTASLTSLIYLIDQFGL